MALPTPQYDYRFHDLTFLGTVEGGGDVWFGIDGRQMIVEYVTCNEGQGAPQGNVVPLKSPQHYTGVYRLAFEFALATGRLSWHCSTHQTFRDGDPLHSKHPHNPFLRVCDVYDDMTCYPRFD